MDLVLSAAPIALEYAVEITDPIPEATSNGMLMMIGQIGGILFILGLEGLKTILSFLLKENN